jgi:hypothetical protein
LTDPTCLRIALISTTWFVENGILPGRIVILDADPGDTLFVLNYELPAGFYVLDVGI